MDLYNGFNGLRHRINWTYFSVLDGLAHPLYSIHKVSIQDILFIESHNKKTMVHLKNRKSHLVNKTLNSWKIDLSNYNFCLSYKGILVNIRNICNIEKDYVELSNGDTVYLSRRFSKNLKFCWYDYLDSLI